MVYTGRVTTRYILAIDPGTTESGVCLIRTSDFKPVYHSKIQNQDVLTLIIRGFETLDGTVFISAVNTEIAVEMVASYGMPVGVEVFETCVWIGRFIQVFAECGLRVTKIFRKDEKLQICNSPKANDASIRQALVDMFAYGEKNFGKGTIKNKGFFYGFSKDQWQAYAVGITYLKLRNEIKEDI